LNSDNGGETIGIDKVGIIGAGTMGSGIAQKCAQEGMRVVMVDMEDRFVQKGLENIRSTLAEAVERKIFKPEQTEKILERVSGTTNLEDVKDADLVIEVIFEDMGVKKDLFKRLDETCEPKTILASNTSSFSITELASSVERKDRFLGLHFFYHPAKNRLLEVIPGKETSQETIALGLNFSRLIGKTGINVMDAPGFAVNRFFVPWLNEAVRLVEDGVNIPTIDAIAKRVFEIGMGPFELMNATGVPIAYHSTVNLGNELGGFYGPSDRLKRQFEKGEEWALEGELDELDADLIEERLLGAVFLVACKLVDEGVADIEDTDRGAKIGLRWSAGLPTLRFQAI
jgi:enoyl-CoA hydratase/3-hydroxyacyl-CoA dehydrogenase